MEGESEKKWQEHIKNEDHRLWEIRHLKIREDMKEEKVRIKDIILTPASKVLLDAETFQCTGE